VAAALTRGGGGGVLGPFARAPRMTRGRSTASPPPTGPPVRGHSQHSNIQQRFFPMTRHSSFSSTVYLLKHLGIFGDFLVIIRRFLEISDCFYTLFILLLLGSTFREFNLVCILGSTLGSLEFNRFLLVG
jgi:hypothetical protein